MQREGFAALHCLPADGGMLRILLGVRSILIDLCFVTTGSQEAQGDTHIAGCPVCQASQVPFTAMLSSNRNEVARCSIQYSRCIPCRGNVLDELKVRLVG